MDNWQTSAKVVIVFAIGVGLTVVAAFLGSLGSGSFEWAGDYAPAFAAGVTAVATSVGGWLKRDWARVIFPDMGEGTAESVEDAVEAVGDSITDDFESDNV